MLKPKKTLKILILVIIAAVVLSVPIGFFVSKKLHIKQYNFDTDAQKTSFKIAHISDLHYPLLSIGLNEILQSLKDQQPDFVFLTGDIIDSSTSKQDVLALADFFAEIGKIGNAYAVLGNHELINSSLKTYKSLLLDSGIILLENKAVQLNHKNKDFTIAGISDKVDYSYETVSGLSQTNSSTVLLLAHRPEKWPQYLDGTKNHVPLITLSGHVHGGQAQIFGRGVVSPAVGFFPKYFDGLYKTDDKSYALLVSRGLGNGNFKHRFFNPYHLPYLNFCV